MYIWFYIDVVNFFTKFSPRGLNDIHMLIFHWFLRYITVRAMKSFRNYNKFKDSDISYLSACVNHK